MENTQNISDTKSLSKYIQFETASSSLAQFVDKWQWKKMQPSMVFLRKTAILLKNRGYFSKQNMLV